VDLYDLEVFAAVAKYRSVTRAAHVLNTSQSSVSRHLKRLEEDHGAALIKSNGRGVALTDRGQSFYQDIEPLVLQVQGLKRKYAVLPQADIPQTLVLAASHGPSASLLPLLMGDFRKSHPRICFDVHTGTSEEIREMVRDSAAEIAIVSDVVPDGSLMSEPFMPEEIIFAVSASHPLARKRKIPPVELAAIPLLVGMGKKGGSRIEKVLKSLLPPSTKINIAYRYQSPMGLKAAVTAGAGVGILYRDIVKNEIRSGTIKVLKVNGISLTGQNHIIYPKDKTLSPAAQEFLALMQRYRSRVAPGG
jgi:DNA-binding transcriptional LysR family regulator